MIDLQFREIHEENYPIVATQPNLAVVGMAALLACCGTILLAAEMAGTEPVWIFLITSILVTLTAGAILTERQGLRLKMRKATLAADQVTLDSTDVSSSPAASETEAPRRDSPRHEILQAPIVNQAAERPKQPVTLSLCAAVDNALDWYRTQGGRSISFSMLALVDDCVSTFEASASLKNIKIGIDISLDVPRNVEGDKARMKEILVILLRNSVWSCTSGFVQICVDVDRNNRGGDTILFTISNFRTTVASTRRRMLSNEMALPDPPGPDVVEEADLWMEICKKLADLVGGNIDFSRGFGAGSVMMFRVALNAVSGEQAQSKRGVAEFRGRRTLGAPSVDRRISDSLLERHRSAG